MAGRPRRRSRSPSRWSPSGCSSPDASSSSSNRSRRRSRNRRWSRTRSPILCRQRRDRHRGPNRNQGRHGDRRRRRLSTPDPLKSTRLCGGSPVKSRLEAKEEASRNLEAAPSETKPLRGLSLELDEKPAKAGRGAREERRKPAEKRTRSEQRRRSRSVQNDNPCAANTAAGADSAGWQPPLPLGAPPLFPPTPTSKIAQAELFPPTPTELPTPTEMPTPTEEPPTPTEQPPFQEPPSQEPPSEAQNPGSLAASVGDDHLNHESKDQRYASFLVLEGTSQKTISQKAVEAASDFDTRGADQVHTSGSSAPELEASHPCTEAPVEKPRMAQPVSKAKAMSRQATTVPKAVSPRPCVAEVPKATADTAQIVAMQTGAKDVYPMKPTSKAIEMPKPLAATSSIAAVQIGQGEARPMKPSSKAVAMTQDSHGATPSAPVKAAAMTHESHTTAPSAPRKASVHANAATTAKVKEAIEASAQRKALLLTSETTLRKIPPGTSGPSLRDSGGGPDSAPAPPSDDGAQVLPRTSETTLQIPAGTSGSSLRDSGGRPDSAPAPPSDDGLQVLPRASESTSPTSPRGGVSLDAASSCSAESDESQFAGNGSPHEPTSPALRTSVSPTRASQPLADTGVEGDATSNAPRAKPAEPLKIGSPTTEVGYHHQDTRLIQPRLPGMEAVLADPYMTGAAADEVWSAKVGLAAKEEPAEPRLTNVKQENAAGDDVTWKVVEEVLVSQRYLSYKGFPACEKKLEDFIVFVFKYKTFSPKWSQAKVVLLDMKESRWSAKVVLL